MTKKERQRFENLLRAWDLDVQTEKIARYWAKDIKIRHEGLRIGIEYCYKGLKQLLKDMS